MFITNEGVRTLKERLKILIKHSEEMKFLVGFFYFSVVKCVRLFMKKVSTISL